MDDIKQIIVRVPSDHAQYNAPQVFGSYAEFIQETDEQSFRSVKTISILGYINGIAVTLTVDPDLAGLTISSINKELEYEIIRHTESELSAIT